MTPEGLPETAEETRALFPDFYNNPVIQHLGKTPYWTVTQTTTKMPVALSSLRSDFFDVKHEIYGVKPTRLGEPWVTETLDTYTELLPYAANAAFYLNAVKSGYIVIDIEPSATQETRERLLQLPWLYAETSMSGKGIHLIVPFPEQLAKDFPVACTKPAIKSPDKTWEALILHWVTFTRNPLPFDAKPGDRDVYETLAPLAKAASKSVPKLSFDELPALSSIPTAKAIIEHMEQQPFARSLASYHNDYSSYEFAVAVYYAHMLVNLRLKHKDYTGPLTREDMVAIIVRIFLDTMEYREKWEQPRPQGNYLTLTIQKAVACALEDAYKHLKDNESE